MKNKLFLFIGFLLAGIMLVNGCNGGELKPNIAKVGDDVKVDYTGKLDDGTVFDSSKGRTPLEFTVGAGQMIAGFDAAIPGMSVGLTKTVKIPASEAYGAYRPEMVVKINKSELPPDVKVGQELTMSNGNQVISVKVIAVSDTDATLDANHPLAGKDLTFDITLVAISTPATIK